MTLGKGTGTDGENSRQAPHQMQRGVASSTPELPVCADQNSVRILTETLKAIVPGYYRRVGPTPIVAQSPQGVKF